MQFEYLADRPDTVPVIGRWYHSEWGRRWHGETEQRSIEKLADYLNRDRIPFILVATDGDAIIGAAQLKYREMGELFPDKEHWIGGVFVAPDRRGCGIGARIVEEIAARAPDYGVELLNLQTERLDGGLYRRLGWRPVQQIDNHGVEVLVMERNLCP